MDDVHAVPARMARLQVAADVVIRKTQVALRSSYVAQSTGSHLNVCQAKRSVDFCVPDQMLQKYSGGRVLSCTRCRSRLLSAA